MRGGRFFVALAVAVSFWTLAGCRTSSPATPPAVNQEIVPALDAEDTARADALARYSQGLIDEYNDDLPGALSNFQQAVALDPDNAAYLDTLGWVYYQQGRYAEALELLERANELRPDDLEIREHIEKTREKLGK